MNDFEFCLSTHFVFGKDAEKKAGSILAKEGAHVVLVLHDSGQFLYDSGLLDQVKKNLEESGLKWVEFGNVKPNPEARHVREGLNLCRKEGVDYVLAIGGGSAIDTGKGICAGMSYDGDVWDLFVGTAKADPARKIPEAVILTYPASGSESGFGTVLGDDVTKQKKGMRGGGNFMRPNYVFMNPELSMTLPVKMTLCGVVDMYSHIVERYFSHMNFGLIDYMSEGAMRAIKHFGYVLRDDPKNHEARGEIMYAGSVAHNDTLGVGRRKDMASHDIGHELSALYDTVHGITISVIMPHWMRYVYKNDVARFARYATEVFQIQSDPAELEKTALAGIDATKVFFEDMLMPTNFKDAQIPTDDLEEIARRAISQHGGKPIGAFMPLGQTDVLSILKAAAKK
jgi:alcohol dehydrogenase YqhD (iron-dependent ADH family)